MKRLLAAFILLAGASVCTPLGAQYSGEFNGITGIVYVEKNGSDEWFPALKGMPVESGDRVRTEAQSSCELAIDDGSYLFVGEKTEATVDHLDAAGDRLETRISLWVGKLIARVEKLRNTKMTVKTPVSVASVRGTEFAVDASADETSVGVFEGQVQVSKAGADEAGDGGGILVQPDQQTTVASGQEPAAPRALTAVMQKNRERLAQLRERMRERRDNLKRRPPETMQAERARALERSRRIRGQREKHRQSINDRDTKLHRGGSHERVQKK